LRKSALQKLKKSFASPSRSAFSYEYAASYYLPEGRYYAAPPALKRPPRQSKSLLLLLGCGFSVLSATAIQQRPPAAIPANITVFTGLPAAQAPHNLSAYQVLADARPGNKPAKAASRARERRLPAAPELDPIQTASIGAPAGIAGQGAADLREDKINRAGKSDLPAESAANARPRLVNYDLHYAALAESSAIKNFAAILKNQGKEAYAVRFMPPQPAAAKKMLASGFVPAPRRPPPPSLPVPKMLASLVNNDKPDVLALGYAAVPVNPARESPFDSILTDKAKPDKNAGRFIPPIGKKDHSWAATPLPASVFQPKEQKCLAEAVYFEARSESLKGQAAVAQVVLNRVRNPAYPDSVCRVVYQNVTWYNRCQFSFACDGKKHRVTELRPWRTAQAVAKAVSAGQIWLPDVGSATHYHAVYVHPQWAGLMDKMEKIGSHIFYRTKGGGWS